MNRFVLIVFLCLLLCMGACSKRESGKSPVTPGEVMEKTKEAAGTAEDYATQELDEFKAKIEELQKKAQTASAEGKAKLDKEIQDLQEKWQAAKQKLDELKSASAESWKKIKSGFDKALDDLKQSLEKAKEEFNK